jgi:predicted TIM-barrel fold metal-dependent hydrolase
LTKSNFAPAGKRLACEYIPTSRADAAAYWRFCQEHFEPDQLAELPGLKRFRPRKPRRFSLRRVIRQARLAGVDVVVANDGSATLKFSAPPVPDSPAEANPWLADLAGRQR